MGRFLALLSSIISLFTLSWILGRWLQPQQCINSSLVSKVVLSSGAPAVQQCSAETRLFGAKVSPDVVRSNLLERLSSLQRIVPLLSSVFPTTIHIQERIKHQLLITPGRIDISSDVLMKPKILERAVLFAQFPTDSDFSAAVKSEFLLDENLWGVNDHSNGSSDSWIANLKGLGNYCRSRHVIVAHQTYCDIHNEYGDSFIVDQKLGPTSWGLVPVFVRSLEKAYAALGIRQKERFLKNLIFLDEPSINSIDSLKNPKSLARANSDFVSIVNNWLMPLMLNKSARQAALRAVSIPKRDPIRYMVIDRSSRDVFPIEKIEMGEWPSPHILTFVEYGIRQYVLSSDVTHEFNRAKLFKRHQVNRVIYVSCRIPSVNNLVQFGGGVKRVLFVRECSPRDVNWPQALTLGLRRYLSLHPGEEFMEFNLSSLRLARHLEGPLENPDRLSSWGRWLKWQSVVTDETEPTALRPLAVIDGVRRFRMY